MFEPSPQALVAQRYSLVREIGRGGMGSVWEAFDHELEAPCALKFIVDQESKPPEVRARFLREARAVAKLQSPHAVSIRGVGECDGALYIAMELLVGETLFARLGRSGRLSALDTARIVEQLGSVLATAHRAGVVHRDLKPENIWLWSEGDPFVKLLDFGVAKLVTDSSTLLKTATGVVVGTPYYMSPEQAAGDRQIDHRSDLWSLAIIAVECLSGKRAFQSTGIGQLFATIINGPTPSLAELYPEGSPALAAWWTRATAKDPRQRFESAVELAREFAAGLLGPGHTETRPYGNVSRPNAEPHLAAGNGARPDPRAALLTMTTPGDGQRSPWAAPLGSTHGESVSPFSTTKAHSTSELAIGVRRGPITAKRVFLALAGVGLVGVGWFGSPLLRHGSGDGSGDGAGLLATAGAGLAATSLPAPPTAIVTTPSSATATPLDVAVGSTANAPVASTPTLPSATPDAPVASATQGAASTNAEPTVAATRRDKAVKPNGTASRDGHRTSGARGSKPNTTPTKPNSGDTPPASTADRVGFW